MEFGGAVRLAELGEAIEKNDGGPELLALQRRSEPVPDRRQHRGVGGRDFGLGGGGGRLEPKPAASLHTAGTTHQGSLT